MPTVPGLHESASRVAAPPPPPAWRSPHLVRLGACAVTLREADSAPRFGLPQGRRAESPLVVGGETEDDARFEAGRKSSVRTRQRGSGRLGLRPQCPGHLARGTAGPERQFLSGRACAGCPVPERQWRSDRERRTIEEPTEQEVRPAKGTGSQQGRADSCLGGQPDAASARRCGGPLNRLTLRRRNGIALRRSGNRTTPSLC